MSTPLEEHTFTHSSSPPKTTFYLAAGPEDGPLIIFCHGWPGISQFWRPQLRAFAALGFRAVAPDMPGYGQSTARKVATDYSMKSVNQAMLALLKHLGGSSAIWVGHDWGAASVWSFAAHFPQHCTAIACLSVPYRTLELGLPHLLSTIDRKLYPEDKYPFGQWSYQRFYETDFEQATAWFDRDPEAVLRKLFVRGSAKTYGLPAATSRVVEDKGWFGGAEKPSAKWREIPSDKIALDEETLGVLVGAMKRTGFWGGDAYYFNHERNARYAAAEAVNEGVLGMPCLFVEAKWDAISDTKNERFCEGMRRYCRNLTETSIEAGHWVAEEKPQETTAAIVRWLVENCPQHWPGFWRNGHVRNKL